jgi:DNA-directed RNA polymerase specialized sigma24 family protein
MSRFPNQPPPKPKLTPQERRVQVDERLKTIRLRMAIWQELDARGITTPDEIGAALGMPAGEVHKLLTRKRREGDVAALEAVAARLGVHTPAPWRRPRHYAVD